MDTHVDLPRALDAYRRSRYVDPATVRLLSEAIETHTHHPELCPDGECRANVEARRILGRAA